MKNLKYSKEIISILLLFTFISLVTTPMFTTFVNSECSCESAEPSEYTSQQSECEDCNSDCPVMPPTPEFLRKRQEELENAPRVQVEPYVSADDPGQFTLIDHLNYIPAQRNQGSCGNCWVWAGTGVMEVALDVQEGLFARLSIQNFTSCHNGGTHAAPGWACCGGGLGTFASRYGNVSYIIPWNNTNAHWQDGGQRCANDTLVPCGTIDTTCNYTITSIETAGIDTHNIAKETAIDNIKAVLHNNKAIYFSYCLWNFTEGFRLHWRNEGETDVWDPDASCGQTMTDDGGCHAVLCVGYNDDDPNNRYWIMVNSWGTAGGGRLNGIFLLDMDMNYNCTFWENSNQYLSFGWQTLNVQYDVKPPTAEAGGPYSGDEGSAITFDASGSSDPDSPISRYEWDWDNDGVYDESTTSPTITHTWYDDYSGTVGLMVVDCQGLSDTDTASVTVNNVAPTVDAGPDIIVNEGDIVIFNGTFTDPGANDTHTATWEWGDGSPTEAGVVTPENDPPEVTGNVTGSHAYCDNGVYTVTLNVTDDDGGWSIDTLNVTVNNVVPTVYAGSVQTVNEGELVYFMGNFTDPGWCDNHTATWDWGDGSLSEPGVLTEENDPPDATGNVTGSHTYCDNGVYTVMLNVTDDDGGWGVGTTEVNVKNVPPTITFFNMTYFDSWCDTVEVEFYAEFTDPGWCDIHTAVWDWGDGSTSPGSVQQENEPPMATGNVTGAHTYNDARFQHYTVRLHVYDDDGGVDTYEYRYVPGPVGGELLTHYTNMATGLVMAVTIASILIGARIKKEIFHM